MPALLHTPELLLHLCKHLPARGSLLQPLPALHQVAQEREGWSYTHPTPILRSSRLPWALEQGQAWVSACRWGWGAEGGRQDRVAAQTLESDWTPMVA